MWIDMGAGFTIKEVGIEDEEDIAICSEGAITYEDIVTMLTTVPTTEVFYIIKYNDEPAFMLSRRENLPHTVENTRFFMAPNFRGQSGSRGGAPDAWFRLMQMQYLKHLKSLGVINYILPTPLSISAASERFPEAAEVGIGNQGWEIILATSDVGFRIEQIRLN